MINLLITDGNSFKAAVLSKFIKKHYKNVKIYLIGYRKIGKLFYTKYADEYIILKNSLKNETNYIEELKRISENNNINHIIPLRSIEIPILLRNKEQLKEKLNYIGDYSNFEKLNNKIKFKEVCDELKINTPKQVTINEISKNKAENKSYVIKPVDKSASRGVKYFKNSKKLYNYYKGINYPIIIEEYFKGNGGGISCFCKEGIIKNYYLHSRLAEWPISGGSSTMRTSLKKNYNEQILYDAKRIIQYVNWSGFCMLEIKHNKKDYTFIEANPRIWGSIYQGLANGTNYLEPLLGKIDISYRDINTYMNPIFFLSLVSYLAHFRLKKLKLITKIIKADPDIKMNDFKALIGQFIR